MISTFQGCVAHASTSEFLVISMEMVYRAQSAGKEGQAAHMQQLQSRQTDLSAPSPRLQQAQDHKLQTESDLQQLSEKLSLHEQAQQQVTNNMLQDCKEMQQHSLCHCCIYLCIWGQASHFSVAAFAAQAHGIADL